MITDSAIRALHAEYTRLTGLKVDLTLGRMHAWELWIARGWNAESLALVVRFMDRKHGREKALSAFKFRWLIEALDGFEEVLAEAQAWRRTKKQRLGYAGTLRATGRDPSPPLPQPRQVGDVMKGEAALAELRKFKESL